MGIFGVEFDFNNIVAMVSVAIPVLAFVWEFVVIRRKRLGYRLQMDTLATDTAHAPSADVLARMHDDGRPLTEPSFVLVRIENAGWREIVAGDYLTPPDDRTGIRVLFRDRRVVGMAVTELSQPALRHFFVSTRQGVTQETDGFGIDEQDGSGLIRLPKVTLNPGAHYKVLAVLERRSGSPGAAFPDPEFQAEVTGGNSRSFAWLRWLARLKLAHTESHTFASRPAKVGLVLLATAVLLQSGLTLFWPTRPAPLDCVGGTLHVEGSTAFAPAVQAAAKEYAKLCEAKGAKIAADDGAFQGSGEGIAALERTGAAAGLKGTEGLADRIAFTDGPADEGHPEILPRPVSYALFTLVVNKDAKVRNLSLAQIRAIYTKKITNWSEVGGANIPVHLVDRHRDSGTRNALEKRVLKGRSVPEADVNDCAQLAHDKPGVCEVDSTDTLLDRTATLPGALGYSEASSVTSADLVKLRIDDMPPTLDGVENGTYPYWQTEYAYTYGEPPADSIAAAFLRYLTDQGGKDILREYGNRPCSETAYPLVCRPT
ncbi:substrate-binding domain-containing protein [Streptomyces coacervatus]|uniref:substrate-binding domain-containing protein n=1 Tax=Streptomyces coacervatus TaxID=647381 RepID=UPI0023DC0AD4|nr:substrate-binding domain-containing protein [Streptomyces coacervatus]MDF2271102.1 substrate-binding domain-containing protein [Streptomyces coacervatus]